MRVQRVLAPESLSESWTLLGDDLLPVDPVESFLAYLTAIERSPNTIKAYAHDLKDWWNYLARREAGGSGGGGRVRGLAATAAAGPERDRVGAAVDRPPLRGVQREPQARRGHHVLRVPRPKRRRGRRPAGDGAPGRGRGGTPCLFPRQRANVSGTIPLADGTCRRMLGRWLETCEIRDEHGRPVHLTPHQWRHTFACRLINRDVPRKSSGSCWTTTRTR